MAEFFSGTLVAGYQEQLEKQSHLELLDQRKKLSIDEYETIFEDKLDTSLDQVFNDEQLFSLEKIQGTVRYYQEIK